MQKVPHLRVPFQVSNGIVATVEQNSIEEVKQCVLACLSTPVGTRVDDPEYGIPAELFSPQIDVNVAPILAAVEEAEPRARLVPRVELDDLVRRVLVGVEAVAA